MANPYTFIPFPNKIERSKIENHHDQFMGISGIIKCKLEVLTELCIKGPNNNPFWSLTQNPKTVFIPGTSLRGMIRSFCESVANGCGFMFSQSYGPYRKSRDKKYEVKNCKFTNSDLQSCPDKISTELKSVKNDAEKENLIQRGFEVCPVCAMFGFTADEVVFKSKIHFSDTDSERNKNIKLSSVQILFSHGGKQPSPQPHHHSFYFVPKSYSTGHSERINKKTSETIHTYQGGEYLGRKYYLHTDSLNIVENGDKDAVAVNPGACFYFNIKFENLFDWELSLLLFALKLKDDWAHKLGYGKPWGLGSIKIAIESLLQLNPNYFSDFEQDKYNDLTSDVSIKAENFIDKFKSEPYSSELQKVMKYQSNVLKYPTF